MSTRVKTDSTSTALPVSRVRTIMRSSPEVSSISPDAIALTAHSARLFISQLVRDAFTQSVRHSPTVLEYKHLSSVVKNTERLSFLQEILPEKVSVKDFRKNSNAETEG